MKKEDLTVVEDFSTIEKDDEGTTRYYNFKGELHRKGGPAIEWYDGSETWYKNGKIHRSNGPAYIKLWNGDVIMKIWYKNGKWHNDKGPAIIFPMSGSVHYYINGKESVIDND